MTTESLIDKDEFAYKYNYDHSLSYYHKHWQSWPRRISDRREQGMARKALNYIGNPTTVLDLPCGAGRFWPLLAEARNRSIIAADSSIDMLKVASEHCPPEIQSQIELLHTSAYNINLDDNSVDTIFCMRLLHHIGDQEKRRKILTEFYRVAQKNVLISLWVDGNYKAWRRRKRDRSLTKKQPGRYTNRFVFRKEEIEEEFNQAGFTIARHYDFLPYYSMWRLYVLRK